MKADWDSLIFHVISTVIFASIGLVLFAISWWIIEKVTPFSIRKEIQEDQNVALGVILGSIFIAIALIVAAAAQEGS